MRFPLADLENLGWWRAGRPPPAAAVAAVRASFCTGSVFHVHNHGVPSEKIVALREAGRLFFDQPAAEKWACAVGRMERSRGWEMYPQHRRHHAACLAAAAAAAPSPLWAPAPGAAEPSASEGILCERFVCGPPSVCSADVPRRSHPFYDSAWGRTFYEPNVWPSGSRGASLRAAFEEAYAALEPAALASLQLVASALGARHDAFDALVASDPAAWPGAPLRHHSRLQLNHYPSQLRRRGREKRIPPIRASRHLDTSLLSLLAREASTDGAGAAPGQSGALEVELAPGRWACVPSPPGTLTVFLGSLAAALTGYAAPPTTHRVSNPRPAVAHDSRRMSAGFVLKPDYSAPLSNLLRASPDYSALLPPPRRAVERGAPALAAELADFARPELMRVGHIGRVGWQSHAMIDRGLSRSEAVARFKVWKVEAVGRLQRAGGAL